MSYSEIRGDIRADLDDDDRIVLTLGGFPSGKVLVSLSPDQWDSLIKQIRDQRCQRLIASTRLQREAHAAAEAAKATQRNFEFYDG